MRRADGQDVYGAIQRFVESALLSDGSLFTPGNSIWTLAAIEDLHRRYNLQPDKSSDRFEVKLRRQLTEAPDSTIQLAAEAIYVHQLIVDDIGGSAKRKLLAEILSWMQSPVAVPKNLNEALDHGIVSGGLAFKTLRWAQLKFVIEFVRLWKGLKQDERQDALTDPWKFKELLWQVPIQSGYAQREALLHLLFPDTFEDIVAREHKSQIAEAFSEYVTEASDDVDHKLRQVRAQAQERFGDGFSYYDPEIRPLWEPVAVVARLWDEFLKWGAKIQQSKPDAWAFERKYKLQLAREVQQAMQALAEKREWIDALASALGSRDPENNLTRWQANQTFVEWCRDHPVEATGAMRRLWAPGTSLRNRLKGFLDGVPDDLLSGSDLLRVLSFFLMGANAEEWPPVTASALGKACKLTGYPPPSPGADEGQRYRHALTFLDRLMKEGTRYGVQLPDHLDAQGLMWTVTNWKAADNWTDQEKAAFLAWRGDTPAQSTPDGGKDGGVPVGGRSLQQLADELYMPLDFFTEVVDLLHGDLRQIIFYGPPGTGKTYVASRLTEYLAPEAETREVVVFHPSYSYEDFIEGFRPAEKKGELSYRLKSGPLLRLAERAAGVPDKGDHVLLIDEINRGNLPRILGELIYALEYRGKPVTLMYRDEAQPTFSLPSNLLVIATMNTTDRSIGLIDAALRRRFHFVPMYPGEYPLEDLLRTWLNKNKPEMIETADIVDRLNALLKENVGEHLQVGHSYFLKDDLSPEKLEMIWKYDIMPFLQDQFFGPEKEKELDKFRLERLREEVVNEAAQPTGAAPEPGATTLQA